MSSVATSDVVSAEGLPDLSDLQAQRQALYLPDPLTPMEKKYYYLLKAMRVYSNKAQTGKFSEALFRSVEEQATQDCVYDVLNLTHDFTTEHALMTLHIWMLHCRFKVDYDGSGLFCGRRMQEQTFERFWEDCTLKIRNVGVPEMRMNKQLENMQKVAFRDMQSYDSAIIVDDDDDMELSAALWNNVFKGDPDVETDKVLMLADYTRREVFNLLQIPAEDFYHGWISWGPVVGETEEDRLARQRSLFEGEWREGIHVDGRMYFYHTTTREKQWEVPDDLYPRRKYALTKHLEKLELEKSSLIEGGEKREALPEQ